MEFAGRKCGRSKTGGSIGDGKRAITTLGNGTSAINQTIENESLAVAVDDKVVIVEINDPVELEHPVRRHAVGRRCPGLIRAEENIWPEDRISSLHWLERQIHSYTVGEEDRYPIPAGAIDVVIVPGKLE